MLELFLNWEGCRVEKGHWVRIACDVSFPIQCSHSDILISSLNPERRSLWWGRLQKNDMSLYHHIIPSINSLHKLMPRHALVHHRLSHPLLKLWGHLTCPYDHQSITQAMKGPSQMLIFIVWSESIALSLLSTEQDENLQLLFIMIFCKLKETLTFYSGHISIGLILICISQHVLIYFVSTHYCVPSVIFRF